MAKTLQEKFIDSLVKRGETEVPVKSTRYRCFTRKGFDGYYFLGRSGSLRYGPNRVSSIPVSKKFKETLLELG